jgi:hypothetical protein
MSAPSESVPAPSIVRSAEPITPQPEARLREGRQQMALRRPPIGRVHHDQRVERQRPLARGIDRHRVEIDLLNFRPRRKRTERGLPDRRRA